jgi:pimeloyl-ACP methyl ester carboxylesterase
MTHSAPDTPVVTDHRVVIPGGTLFARRWSPVDAVADAPAILLFHDSLGSTALWRDFPDELAQRTGLPVIAYDRLGFGRSDAAIYPLRQDFIAAESRVAVPALIEQLGLGAFIAFGHSVGGAMAIEAAAAFPGRCRAVISESAQSFVEDRTLDGVREAKRRFADPDQAARIARHHGDKTEWILDAWIETWLAPERSGWAIDATLARVRCPVLAIHGDRDEFGSDAHPRRIVDRATGSAKMLLIDACGHVPHRDQPEILLSSVSAFLRAAGL